MDRARPRPVPSAPPRVLRPRQRPEGRRRVQRRHHDRQPDLRARDRHAGIRVRLRRHPANRAGRPGRDPQRDRHRRLGSEDRSATCRAHFDVRRRSTGKRTVKRALLEYVGLPARRRRDATAADRDRHAAHAPEGLRPVRGGGGPPDGAGRGMGHARQRRSAGARTCGGTWPRAHPGRVSRRGSGSTSSSRT